ncbi:hypothetical protein cand_022040 [Cryptosporidium andersoni]|uniref:Uncharacterized protein n=1 Tax=Cryptosporidium andersoni TaxID=117008 RepID=A0A1J4MVZ1_9CRYT|nr:hypothetical protein cand_022040 [Cryptosporidium andersoni]
MKYISLVNSIIIFSFIIYQVSCIRSGIFGQILSSSKDALNMIKQLGSNDGNKQNEQSQQTKATKNVTVTINQLNQEIGDSLVKNSNSLGFGSLAIPTNPYMSLDYRACDYSKCISILSQKDTWFPPKIMTDIQKEMETLHLTLPQGIVFSLPSTEVIAMNTLLQVCVSFFLGQINSGNLRFDKKVCVAPNCLEKINLLCKNVVGPYNPSSVHFRDTKTMTQETQKICSESRKEISNKFPNYCGLPADISLSGKSESPTLVPSQ